MPSDLDPRENQPVPPKILNRLTHPAGTTIIMEGDTGTRAYYIEKGRVEVIKNEGSNELKVCELGVGSIFGEMALINDQPRSATVRSTEMVVLSVITADQIQSHVNKVEDRVLRALIKVLVHRLKNTTQGQLQEFISNINPEPNDDDAL